VSPDRFYLVFFLAFIVWMAALLWIPGFCPFEKAPGVKRPTTTLSVTVETRPGTDATVAPSSAPATPFPGVPASASQTTSPAAVVPVQPGP